MIDIHSHILPGIDDGAGTMDEAIEMARIAAADGIRTIVATPHIKSGAPRADEIAQAVSGFNAVLGREGIPVTVLQGADVPSHLNPADLPRYTLNGTRYILIEFPHSHLPASARETLFNISMAGLIPIITHPERNSSVIRKPEMLFDLLNSNVKVQITADSLSGFFGADIAACARFLLKRGVVDLIASDAHSSTYRRPILSEAVRIAAKMIGKSEAVKLVTDNPDEIINSFKFHVSSVK
jgi:protein-tyrosine phosphatase